MEDNRSQLIERLKQSNNVLVTVNNNPTVDQLSACIGVTLLLNKLGKHATAVFSGQVPSTIEFLKPEETLEKNTDSLRDFIIALDKAKADKLRYKVEDTMVKIFITPYKTSISDKDLEFSQGDFNVDVVLALGIHEKEQVDQAIMAHGRILHDAVVMSVDNQQGNVIGTINWIEDQASSLCEMLTSIADDLQPQSLDEQIATALLTGIVAETERFSNEKTSSVTMSMSSKLMAAGANQQLVATELEPKPEPEPTQEVATEPPKEPESEPTPEPNEQDGTVIIDHPEDAQPAPPQEPELPPIDPNEIDIDKEGTLRKAAELAEQEAKPEAANQESQDSPQTTDSKLVSEPPILGGTLTANSRPEQLDPATDPLSVSSGDEPLLSHSSASSVPNEAKDTQTLEEIEKAVQSDDSTSEPSSGNAAYPTSYFDSNTNQQATMPASDVSGARDAVQDAITSNAADNYRPEPIAGLNAQPIDLDMGRSESSSTTPVPNTGVAVDPSTGQPQFPPNLVPPSTELPPENTSTSVETPESPPPVPPPMVPPAMPPFDNSSTASPQI